MNQSELDSILKKARTPQPPEKLWEELPGRIVRQLNRPLKEERPARSNWFSRFAWALGTAACVLLAFVAGHWHGQRQAELAQSQDLLANVKLVRETLAMFPNQVRAIVQDGGGLHVVLSNTSNVPASPPLYVCVCDGKNCLSLVTFSGQEIQAAGQRMTVLADTQGGIILMGSDFVWSSHQKNNPGNHLKIEAKTLNIAAL
jgi:hypothetical protein